MHIFDTIIILVTLIVFIIAQNKHKMNPKILSYSLILVLITYMVHQFLNLSKWQLIPLYLFWFLFVIFLKVKSTKRLFKAINISLSLITLLLSLGLLYAFPAWDIPKPSGTYEIGTLYDIINDEDRLELYTDDPADTRRFMVRVWYPADHTDSKELSKWIGFRSVSTELAKGIGLPAFALSQISQTDSNAYTQVSISDDKETYPIVIISHGWGGFMSLHTDLAEELASRGYIVLSIDHTYGSVATSFIDETVYQNKGALPNRNDPSFLDAAHQLVYTYAGDISRTLDYLEEKNSSSYSFFKGRLDLDYIGLIGHSTGGGADVAVALNDNRIKALLGLDAWVEPIEHSNIIQGLSIPAIFLRSETWQEGPNNHHLFNLIQHSAQAKLYQIDGTTHSDFTMAYMFSPLTRMIGFTGSLDSDYLLQMQKDIMNSFFDKHLKGIMGQDSDLSVYKELKLIDVS